MIVNQQIQKDRQEAIAIAKRTKKTARVGRVTIIPAFNGRGLDMDTRKRLMREVGGGS